MNGKNFLVVGASSGIGKRTAEILIEQGAQVYSAQRKEPDFAVQQHFSFDAQNPNATEWSGLPDILDGVVYAPGTINLKPFHRFSLDDFKRDFDIHVLGAVAVLQAILPKLKKSETASVVLFSTVAVQTGMGFHASVAASKGAIEGLTRSLAAEWAMQKIRVNAIAPALTDTPLAANLLSTDEKREASNKRHPLGRFGTSDDIAEATVFLLSNKSSWMTGQIIGIDGGLGKLKV